MAHVDTRAQLDMPSQLNVDGGVIGAVVKVTTNSGEQVEGIIFTLDPVAKLLIVEESNGQKTKTRIFQLDALKNIEVVKQAPKDVQETLPSISEDDLMRLEMRNRQQAERALASIGKNVSAEAQAIFDALNKTMPCEWDGQKIRVMGEVVITPPYQPKNCSASKGPTLQRVQKVLEGEQKRLQRLKN